MIRAFLVFVLCIAAFPARAQEDRCYQLAKTPGGWSRTPEQLCTRSVDGRAFVVTLRTGMLDAAQEIARFQMSLLKRVRCLDCNNDEFGVANPSNSVFNALAIRFDGKRDPSTGKEQGAVYVGQTRFAYRSLLDAAAEPPPAASAPPMQPVTTGTPPPAKSLTPMDPGAFARLHSDLKGSFNADTATSMIRAAAETNWFTAEQATLLVRDFPAPSFRYEPALLLGRRLIDPQNRHLLIGQMLGDDARRLREALQ